MTDVELMNTTNDIPAFTPSLGLRYWMNKMKRTASKTTGQDSKNNSNKNNDKDLSHQTKLSSPTTILSNSTTTTKRNGDMQSLGNKSLNDATSTISISGITGSYFGISSVNGYDIDSSLRVHHHGASSERSSFLSDDIQSNASIKSKPWISQLISSTHNNGSYSASYHNEGETSSNSFSNSGAYHSTEPSPITQHVYHYGRDLEDDSADDEDDRLDGDIFGTNSYQASHLVLPDDIQQNSNKNSNNNNTDSKQYQQQQQQQQQQRRWSENGYPPHTLGRIKAGLGRLMGRDHPSSANDNRGNLP